MERQSPMHALWEAVHQERPAGEVAPGAMEALIRSAAVELWRMRAGLQKLNARVIELERERNQLLRERERIVDEQEPGPVSW